MKALFFAWMVLVFTLPLQADVLDNSNFGDGCAHWSGDAQPRGTGNPLADPTSAPAGVTINLKEDQWTKIYQSFSTHETILRCTIELSLSPDYHATPLAAADPLHRSHPPGLTDLPGNTGLNIQQITGDQMFAMFVINANTKSSGTFPFHLDLTKSGSQTFTTDVPVSLTDSNGEGYTLLVAFPPGHGSVTVTKISLSRH